MWGTVARKADAMRTGARRLAARRSTKERGGRVPPRKAQEGVVDRLGPCSRSHGYLSVMFIPLADRLNRNPPVASDAMIFATAIREDEETSSDSFIRFAGFKNNSSVGAALLPFLKGNNAIFEKRGSRVRYRERFMRLWVLLQVVNIPSLFPAGRPFIASSEQGLLLPYLSNALK
jgi:hypothetical protein